MLPLILLLGCGTTETPEPEACALTWTQIHPTDTTLSAGGPVEVVLSEADATATFGDGTYRRDGNIVGWRPEEPLTPGESVTLTLQTCAGDQSLPFTVADDGATFTADALDTTFEVDLTSGLFLRPASASILLDLVPDTSTRLLFGLTSEAGGAATVRIGIANPDGTQDLCSRTVDLPATRSDGVFHLPPTSLTLPVGDLSLDVRGLTFTGASNADGTVLSGGSVSMYLGVQAMADEWADGDAVEACRFFGTFQVPCTACPDNTDEDCLVFDLVELSGEGHPGSPAEVTSACPS